VRSFPAKAVVVIGLSASFLLGASMIPFAWNVFKTWRHAPRVLVDDPWGHGGSLEWATSCPPPRHNFDTIPRIRSERPAFDLHHPEVAAADQVSVGGDDKGALREVYGDADMGGST